MLRHTTAAVFISDQFIWSWTKNAFFPHWVVWHKHITVQHSAVVFFLYRVLFFELLFSFFCVFFRSCVVVGWLADLVKKTFKVCGGRRGVPRKETTERRRCGREKNVLLLTMVIAIAAIHYELYLVSAKLCLIVVIVIHRRFYCVCEIAGLSVIFFVCFFILIFLVVLLLVFLCFFFVGKSDYI